VPKPYVRDAVVLALAVGVFGVSFGVLAAAAGLSLAKASAMSLLVFTGASQFAAIGVVAVGGSTGAALGSAFLLAARNAAYGLTLSPVVGEGRLRRVLGSQLVIDEAAAMAAAQDDQAARRGAFWVTGAAIFVTWNVGTVLGVLAGQAIGDPRTYGLDAAFPAGFVALIAPQLRHRDGRVAAAFGALIALALTPLTAAGLPIVLATAGVVPALATGVRRR
jgi:predicted branched-subunit amino acid permease